MPPLPFTPGNEGAGEVSRSARASPTSSRATASPTGPRSAPMREERLIAADKLVQLPDAISYETARRHDAEGADGPISAAPDLPGRAGRHTILVHAAAGGVGLILCQWAKALGATVIGTVGIAGKGEARPARPAPTTSSSTATRISWRASRRSPKGEGATSSMTASARRRFPASLDCLRPLGMFVSFGSASGQIEAFNIGILGPEGLAVRDAADAVHITASERADTAWPWPSDLFGRRSRPAR